jgi:hypothetical protein
LQWTFENNGSGWTIKSAGSGKFIGIEGDANDGTPLVAVDNAFVWDIWPDERDNSHFRCVASIATALCELIGGAISRIFAPNTGKNFDLSDHGSSTPGTKVQLWDKTPGKGQTWIIGD